MPIYCFRCPNCDGHVEDLLAQPIPVNCPQCGTPMVRNYSRETHHVVADKQKFRDPVCGSLGEKLLEHREFKNEGHWDHPEEFMRCKK